eukprot:TRINITY_DN23839_c0_g1_i1.p1 TRINITY_DN23839_c0_g1~~TRINITY_DN23839_c0_g1_i1.p1  ORF type:complete len:490 (-),score=76.15 TRINITY_DN23839_c0_g1_i1:210-1679(-)
MCSALGCAGAACLACLFFFLVPFQMFIYNMIAYEFVKEHDEHEPPLHLTPESALEWAVQQPWMCNYSKSAFDGTWQQLTAFNKKQGWKKLSFPSRQAEGVPDVTITAWYLESPVEPAKSPTVLVLHGNNVNNNDHSVQTIGAWLRELNYNVIMPNLRGHGDSNSSQNGNNKRFLTWGAREVYDVLGAVDYVLADPDGTLGGKKKAAEVGLMGFSMGGYINQIAFGVQRDVGGLFIDSAVFDARKLLKDVIEATVGRVMAWFLFPQAWFWAERISGQDLDELTPANSLQGGDRRKIASVHASDDVLVPYSQEEMRLEHLKKTDFVLTQQWYPETVPSSDAPACSPHCQMHLTKPHAYKNKLCVAFADMFGRDPTKCPSAETSPVPTAADVVQSTAANVTDVTKGSAANVTAADDRNVSNGTAAVVTDVIKGTAANVTAAEDRNVSKSSSLIMTSGGRLRKSKTSRHSFLGRSIFMGHGAGMIDLHDNTAA